jgi:1-phosphofructokinase
LLYTLTLNPALDYLVTLPKLTLAATNRVVSEAAQWGGKGVNVSRMARHLGVDSVAMGFLAGFTGQAIERGLISLGIKSAFIGLEGLTRINIKIKAEEETEINGLGPPISPADLSALAEKLALLSEDDLLVMAGSVPPTVPTDIYARFIRDLKRRAVKIALDTSGPALAMALPEKPFLIKPNLAELNALVGGSAIDEEAIIASGRQAQKLGAQNVLISMASRGALLIVATGEVFQASAPVGEVKNSAGAGDSMLAGFLVGQSRGLGWAESLRLGAAAGSASAFCASLATKEEIEALSPKIEVTRLY